MEATVGKQGQSSWCNPSFKRFISPNMRTYVQRRILSLVVATTLLSSLAFAISHRAEGTNLQAARQVLVHGLVSVSDRLQPMANYVRQLNASLAPRLVVKVSSPGRWCTYLHVDAQKDQPRVEVNSQPSMVNCTVASHSHRESAADSLATGESRSPGAIKPLQAPGSVTTIAATDAVADIEHHAHSHVSREHAQEVHPSMEAPRHNLSSKSFETLLSTEPYSFDIFTLDGLANLSPATESARHSLLTFAEQATVSAKKEASSRADPLNNQTNTLDGFIVLGQPEPLLIMLDPGHGGSDNGTIGPEGTREKFLTRDIAERVKILAELHKDIEIVLSRNDDTGMSRAQRVNSITEVSPDALLSLHFNHLPQTEVVLVETYYATEADLAVSHEKKFHNHGTDKSKKQNADASLQQASARSTASTTVTDRERHSRNLARLVQSHVFAEVQSHNPRAIDAGVKSDAFYVLTQSGVPGALIELSCLSNPAEEKRLTSEAYRTDLANALMDAIREFANQWEPRNTQVSDKTQASSSA